MIELIITIAVLSFGVVGVYSAFVPMIQISKSMSSRLTAAYLAQEGLEITRNIRDNNFIEGISWSDGLISCNLGCQADYTTGTPAETFESQLKAYDQDAYLSFNIDGFYGYATSDFYSPFRRKITITSPDDDILEVLVEVFWQYNGKQSSYEASEFLYNWY